MHSASFLLRKTKPELKLALNILRYYCMSLYKPKAVCAASEQQYTAEGRDVQVPRCGIYV